VVRVVRIRLQKNLNWRGVPEKWFKILTNFPEEEKNERKDDILLTDNHTKGEENSGDKNTTTTDNGIRAGKPSLYIN